MSTKKTLLVTGFIFILGLSILFGLVISQTKISTDDVYYAMPGETVQLVIPAGKWTFEPSLIVLEKGEGYKLRIINEDSYAHGFAVREFKVNEYIPANGTVTIEINPQESGIFTSYCTVVCGEGHTHMRGRIEVR